MKTNPSSVQPTRGQRGWSVLTTVLVVVVCGCGSESRNVAATDTSNSSDTSADTVGDDAIPDTVAGDSAITPIDSEKCLQLCEAAPGSTCELDRPQCLDDCRARTQDIPTGCARCITDNSEAMFETCIDSGNGPNCGCSEAVFSAVYENGCETFCSSIGVETSHSFDERCAAFCGPATPACEDDDIIDCRTQCSGHASGLSRRCARCLLDASTSPYGTCIDFGEGPSCACYSASFAPISVDECATFCTE